MALCCTRWAFALLQVQAIVLAGQLDLNDVDCMAGS